MLQRLVIRDFVLADRLELEFATGFGALTGETGAGKSILVDALAFVLGDRADATLGAQWLRTGRSVGGIRVAAPAGRDGLAARQRDGGRRRLILRRTLDAGGRSRVWINGSPSTVQQLREISESLVDIHGQHAHQSLLRADAQRALLDDHADLGESVAAVAGAWRAWRDAAASLAAATGGAEALLREREELIWQVGEIEALAFSAEGWESLNQEHRRLAHAAGLIEGADFAGDAGGR